VVRWVRTRIYGQEALSVGSSSSPITPARAWCPQQEARSKGPWEGQVVLACRSSWEFCRKWTFMALCSKLWL
jgi:hypothetical protein